MRCSTVITALMITTMTAIPCQSQDSSRITSTVFTNPGARSIGLGGAFAAIADDATAAFANPAGLVQILRPEISIELRFTSLMNDVHMSHAMEFPYPQSMSNCVTCHEGKLDVVLSDANFKIETCKSCHPVTGAVAEGEEPEYGNVFP